MNQIVSQGIPRPAAFPTVFKVQQEIRDAGIEKLVHHSRQFSPVELFLAHRCRDFDCTWRFSYSMSYLAHDVTHITRVNDRECVSHFRIDEVLSRSYNEYAMYDCLDYHIQKHHDDVMNIDRLQLIQ